MAKFETMEVLRRQVASIGAEHCTPPTQAIKDSGGTRSCKTTVRNTVRLRNINGGLIGYVSFRRADRERG